MTFTKEERRELLEEHARLRAGFRRTWSAGTSQRRDEYDSERLDASQLGVGRFHDGRGL